MMKTKLVSILWFLSLLFWLPSCSKNDTATIMPIGEEEYIEDILSVVSDLAFWTDFGSYDDGPIPPDIQGKYLMAPKLRISTNVAGLPQQLVEPNLDLCFSRQHNGIAVMGLNETTETLTDTVFVRGSGNAFTAYFIEEKSTELTFPDAVYHVRIKRGVIMKGRVSEAGLSDFRMATVILEAEDDSQGVLEQYPPGSYFIYKDADGLVKRMDES